MRRDGDVHCAARYRFGEERLVPGKRVSIRERDGRTHTVRAALMELC
jgi:hypothetical protein